MTRAALAPEQVRDNLLHYTDRELLYRAMRNLSPTLNQPTPRWVCVMNAFAVGSTVAHALCRHFELDPDEELKPPRRRRT